MPTARRTFMPKPVYGDNARACTCTSRSGRTASPPSRAMNMPACRRVPVLHRRHHQARQGTQRLHQPVDQLLQASGPRLRGSGPAGLFGPQPLGLLPHSVRHVAEGQRVEVRFPDPPQPLSRLCRDADGRSRRHQDKIHPGLPWTRSLRPAAEGAQEDPTVCGSLREALQASTRTRLPEAGGGSTTTRSMPISS